MNSRARIEKLGFAESAENIFWSYDGEEFSFRSSPDQLYLEFPAYGCKTAPDSIRDEAFRAARLISERSPRPMILYSGGIDSEVVVLSFFLQKLPFSVGIIDYHGRNAQDTARARAFCDRLGIGYRIIELDLTRFWENDLESVARKVHCASPQIAAHCWISTQLDEYVIFGDGDPTIMRSNHRVFETKSERWAVARWMLMNNKAGCPRFYQYTAELEASFLFEPLVAQFVELGWDFFDFRKFMYLKPFIFNKYFDCALRPKLTGFESIGECEEYRKKLELMIKPIQDISWEYSDAKRWALQSAPPRTCIPLRESLLPEEEREILFQHSSKHHSLWVDERIGREDYASAAIGTTLVPPREGLAPLGQCAQFRLRERRVEPS